MGVSKRGETTSSQNRKVKIDDVNWYPVDDGAFCADVYNEKAGEVVLEVGPRRAGGRFFAQAIGFMGITIWERNDFDSLNEAQLNVLSWWKHVTHGSTAAAPAAPQKRRPVKADAPPPTLFNGRQPKRQYISPGRQPATPAAGSRMAGRSP